MRTHITEGDKMGVKELLDEAQAVSQEKYALELEMLSIAKIDTWDAERIAELMPQVNALTAKFLALTDEAAQRLGIQK